MIQADVAANPEVFGGREFLVPEVMHVRTAADDAYYMVGLRTNIAETGVIGVLGDGMVFYPWEWCTTCKFIKYCFNFGGGWSLFKSKSFLFYPFNYPS